MLAPRILTRRSSHLPDPHVSSAFMVLTATSVLTPPKSPSLAHTSDPPLDVSPCRSYRTHWTSSPALSLLQGPFPDHLCPCWARHSLSHNILGITQSFYLTQYIKIICFMSMFCNRPCSHGECSPQLSTPSCKTEEKEKELFLFTVILCRPNASRNPSGTQCWQCAGYQARFSQAA